MFIFKKARMKLGNKRLSAVFMQQQYALKQNMCNAQHWNTCKAMLQCHGDITLQY